MIINMIVIYQTINSMTITPSLRRPSRSPISLGRRFYQIAVAVAAEVHEGTGLIPLEFGVMIYLHETPGLDQHTLAERMALDRTTTSAIVYRLEQQGLIERAVNGEDRRARVLRLTRKGQALHDRQRPKAQAAQDRILSVLTAAERRSLIDMLVRVIDANRTYARPGAGRRPRGRKATQPS
jgi:DNA-binding MarR family transcriptional regulator